MSHARFKFAFRTRFRVLRVISSNGGGPTDLLLELVRVEGPITADDTQAMGLG